MKDRLALETQVKENRERATLLESLAGELRIDPFVGFILQETFDLLATRASEELLRMALSRHVGDLVAEGMGAKLPAVFIDEGFGTLDPDTLEDVVDALERLREGNLLVGVMSHVPVLAQRLRSGLRVEKVGGWSRILRDDAA